MVDETQVEGTVDGPEVDASEVQPEGVHPGAAHPVTRGTREPEKPEHTHIGGFGGDRSDLIRKGEPIKRKEGS